MDHQEALKNFLNKEGLLKQMPVRHRLRAFVYLWALEGLEKGPMYTQGQINEHIKRILAVDEALAIRRALVDFGLLQRTSDGRSYWRADKEMTIEDFLN